MRRLIIAVLALLVLAWAAEAKVLVIVANPTPATVATEQQYVNSIFARWVKLLGFEYDTYSMNYVKYKTGSGLYTHHGTSGSDSLDIIDIASQGGYSCAIVLNMPNLLGYGSSFDTGNECVSQGLGTASSNFCQWINRNSVSHPFPIPLIIPIAYPTVTTNNFGAAYTGLTAGVARTWTTTNSRSLTNARGDSIYTVIRPINLTESMVAGRDSLSFVRLLVWRDDEATWDALDTKPTYLWMTVGSGNHKVVWFPYAHSEWCAFLWPAVIGMFEQITPIDMPIVAELFGSSAQTFWGTSQDTVSLAANFKAIKDYAVANGMKIDLLGLTWSMKNETGADAHVVFQTRAYTYQNAFPNNIRITPSTYESWRGSGHYDWIGSQTDTTYHGYLARIVSAQTGLAANFQSISLTRAYTYLGQFQSPTTYLKQDSILTALAAKGIADVYNLGTGSYASAPPGDLTHSIVGAQRTWIGRGDGAKEMRFHPISSLWRYALQQTNDANGDTLRISYLNTAQYNDNRVGFMRYFIPTSCGYYRTTAGQAVGSQGINIGNATHLLATHGAGYQPGMHLNALTFTGGSKTKYLTATSGAGVHSAADSSRSLFLDIMKMINNQVRMANYIVDVYGTTDQPVFVYSWMEDVNHDRRLGRTYSNNHVNKE